MDKLKYWVWLTSKKFMDAYKISLLLERFDDICDIYEADVYEDIEGIGIKEKRELLDKSTDEAERIIEKAEIAGARIVTYDDEGYPPSLKEIQPPPYVLYMKGQELQWEEQLSIGVIGARKCSDYGRVAAQKLCYELAAAGVTIVSGMARGIDSIASISALKAGGKTIAVLGCGIDIVYPPENDRLMKAIEENGVVITEYPPSCPPYGHNFPQRNRIISGLSRGIMVIEAGKRSGTFTTVERAKDYGKDIFAVPGGIFHAESEGTNDLIKKGAILTTSVRDIFEQYPYEASVIERAGGTPIYIKMPEYEQKTKEKTVLKTYKPLKNIQAVPKITVDDDRYKGLNDVERSIIALLIKRSMHIDELARESGINIAKLNSVLPVLEMMGHISKMSGNNYKLNI